MGLFNTLLQSETTYLQHPHLKPHPWMARQLLRSPRILIGDLLLQGPLRFALFLGLAGSSILQAQATTAVRQATSIRAPICPEVEVVFCIDTTGSMGGLIGAAKDRIWRIVNGIAGALNGPRLKVGLVAYRDRGDVYITKVFNLTDNLESVQTELASYQANGGGDTPESVNQALSDALKKVSWTAPGSKSYRTIFLVGDAPPHMDYRDDIKYPETCREARSKGIVINAIQCGEAADTKSEWMRISSLGGGDYACIPQSGGVRFIGTPYDAWLTEFSSKLLATAVYVGTDERRNQWSRDQQNALDQSARALKQKDLQELAREADRGEFRGKAGRSGTGGLGLGREAGLADLVEIYQRQGVSGLKGLAPSDLPESLRSLTAGKLESLVRGKALEREGLLRQIQDLSDLRDDSLDAQKSKDGVKSFDDEVLDLIRKQAAAICH
jgi:hypothetical protein